MQFETMAEEYSKNCLNEDDLAKEPITQFRQWFQEWAATKPYDANAMIVATVDSEGWPSARAVLLKGLDDRGFIFHTNRQSAKGNDIETSKRAALCFLWHPMERQVRIVGTVEHLPDDESDAYFASRPRGAQIGAWASPQSDVIDSRSHLRLLIAKTETQFAESLVQPHVQRPPHWGGYLVRPIFVEFWQGRRDRLHDRLRYRRKESQADLMSSRSDWHVERLAP